MTITQEEARALAIRYHAFRDADQRDDLPGIIVWGEMLMETQAQIDTYVSLPNATRRAIESARARLAADTEGRIADAEATAEAAAKGYQLGSIG